MSFEKKFELLNRQLHREKAARIAAEEILTFKSIELYKANQDLIDLNKILEKENLSRTDDLVKSRLRYEQLVESASDIIYEVDAQGHVLFANQITERILQKSREDLIGINVIDLIADSHKEEIRNAFYRSIQNKEAMRYNEFPCLRKDGEIVWLSQNFHNDFEIIAGQKIFKGGKGVARDITSQFYENLQLERNEIKYRNVMENMDLGYIEVDLDGRILKAYDKFLKMTGYSKEDLIGNIAEEILLPEEYKGLMKTQNDARIKGQMGSYEVEMIAKNGERLWTLISGGPILDEKGNAIGSVGIHYDLTQQKAVQKELLLAKKEAENAQKVEQDFLANMSHEIRTPLNAIIGISHLLYDTNPSAEQLEYFTIIKNS
ncbi:MAG: PAS domain S-box-containing protein, partial [Psychroserpens sp.]